MLRSSFAVYKINRSFIFAKYVLYYCWLKMHKAIYRTTSRLLNTLK